MILPLLLAFLCADPEPAMCYALFNTSGSLHLHWRVEGQTLGVEYYATEGLLGPHEGQTIAIWRAGPDQPAQPDVMACVSRRHVAYADTMATFESCQGGPCVPVAAECVWFDLDWDGDVDQDDFGALQRRIE